MPRFVALFRGINVGKAAVPHGLHAPHPITPEEAWMVRPLRPGVLGSDRGTVRCAHALAAEHYWRE
jgi:putative acetyltransferase